MKTNQSQKNTPLNWQQLKLGDVVSYVKGFAFKSQDYKNNGTRIIRVSDLGVNTIHDNNMIFIDNKNHRYSKWELRARLSFKYLKMNISIN